MDGPTHPTPQQLEVLLDCLASNDDLEIGAVTPFLSRLGKPAIEFLAKAAFDPRKRPQHRVAIFDALQRLGSPLGLEAMYALQDLLQDRDPEVAHKAELIIMRASPCGVPDNPAIAALARAFNPFLATVPRCSPRRTRLSDYTAAQRGDRDALWRRLRSSAALQRREERAQRKRKS